MKIILITGASSGIGKATALRLLEDGHVVYGAARSIEKMKDLKEKGAHILHLDITKNDDIQSVVDTIIAEQGRVDVLINNAGFGLYGSVEEVSIDDARYQFEVNIFGLARLTQLVISHMRNQNSGTIVNISSMGGKMYTLLGAWYHATKHALEGWSDCLRIELKPFGIHTVIIEPGIIETEFGNVMKEPLLKKSGHGPYKEMAQGLARATDNAYASGNGSPATAVANTIAKVVRNTNPRTRYPVGKYARLLMWIRSWLGDRIFDRLVVNQMG